MPSSLRIRLTEEADAALTDLLQCSAESWGDERMLAYAAQLYATIEQLGVFPFLGRSRDDLADGLRGHLAGQHMICYRVTDDAVIIRRILHHQRDINRSVDIETL